MFKDRVYTCPECGCGVEVSFPQHRTIDMVIQCYGGPNGCGKRFGRIINGTGLNMVVDEWVCLMMINPT